MFRNDFAALDADVLPFDDELVDEEVSLDGARDPLVCLCMCLCFESRIDTSM